MTRLPANLPTPRTTSTLRVLARPPSPPVSLLMTQFFQCAQAVEVDLRGAEGDAVRRHRLWLLRSPWPRAAAPWTECSPRSGTRRPGFPSARPAPPSGPDPRRGTRRCSRRARRPAPPAGNCDRASDLAASAAFRPAAGAWAAGSRGCGRGRGCGGCAAAQAQQRAFAAGAAAAVPSTFAITVPLRTLPPALTSTAVSLPAAVDGTSMVAFSVSSVTSGVSISTVSPGLTSTSTTLTSSKLPRSGTATSTSLTAHPPAALPGSASSFDR